MNWLAAGAAWLATALVVGHFVGRGAATPPDMPTDPELAEEAAAVAEAVRLTAGARS